MRILPLLFITALTAGCATQGPMTPPSQAGLITPMEAVRAAHADPQRGISGTFVMTVQATDITPEGIFLNSERDYRHPLNLNVRIAPNMQEDVERQLGLPIHLLVNRRLLITGTARPARIDFTSYGKPSGKYYFQTHLPLYLAENVSLAP